MKHEAHTLGGDGGESILNTMCTQNTSSKATSIQEQMYIPVTPIVLQGIFPSTLKSYPLMEPSIQVFLLIPNSHRKNDEAGKTLGIITKASSPSLSPLTHKGSETWCSSGTHLNAQSMVELAVESGLHALSLGSF